MQIWNINFFEYCSDSTDPRVGSLNIVETILIQIWNQWLVQPCFELWINIVWQTCMEFKWKFTINVLVPILIQDLINFYKNCWYNIYPNLLLIFWFSLSPTLCQHCKRRLNRTRPKFEIKSLVNLASILNQHFKTTLYGIQMKLCPLNCSNSYTSLDQLHWIVLLQALPEFEIDIVAPPFSNFVSTL